MRAWRLIALVVLLAACGLGRAPVVATPLPPDETERVVRLAETRAQAGAYAEAERLFEQALRRPNAAFADRALLGLTRLLVDSANASRDYRRAYVFAERLAREHPASPYAAEGRAWRDLLGSYLARGQELERRAQELEQSARELEGRAERIQGLDQELQQRAREAERLAQEVKRLKIVDAELERRSQELERLSFELERRNKELERLKRLDIELEQQKKKP